MHAGYDYLLSPGRIRRKKLFYAGILSSFVGAIFLIAGCLYYILDYSSETLTEGLTVKGIPDPISAPLLKDRSDEELISPRNNKSLLPTTGSMRNLVISEQTIGYGALNPLAAWSDTDAYEPLNYKRDYLLKGFEPTDIGQAQPVGTLPNVNRLVVPEISIDSPVAELNILVKGHNRKYESPDNVIGHIPEGANPGEAGGAWFFAHLESPIVGEGSIFFNLPLIPSMLEKGNEIYIIAENEHTQYLYLITSSEILHEDEMKLYSSGWASIHLVTCVPAFIYDHRLIISGELVGIKVIAQ